MEFGLDYAFIKENLIGWRAQAGLIDTMSDLFFDLTGALFSGVILTYILKTKS